MFQKKYLILFIILFLIVFLFLASEVLLPFLVGLIIAYILNPIVKWLKKIGLSHLLSVLLALLLSLFTFFGSLIFLVPIFLDQLQIIIQKMPFIFDKVNSVLSEYNNSLNIIDKENYNEYFSNLLATKSGELFNYLFNFITLSINKTFAIFNFIGLVFITPIVTFYILYDWENIFVTMKSKFNFLSSRKLDDNFKNINNLLSSFFRGQLIVALLLAVFYSFFLFIVGIEGAISIGILIGVFSFLPYLGTIFGLLISLSFAVMQFGSINYIIIVIIIFVIGQFLESYLLSPKFISKSVGLHPLFTMFVIIASGAAFGFIGVLLAIPVSAVILTLISDVKK